MVNSIQSPMLRSARECTQTFTAEKNCYRDHSRSKINSIKTEKFDCRYENFDEKFLRV